jgi:hypothetical protein
MKDNSPKSHGCPVCNSTHDLELTPYIDAHHPSSNIFENLQ